MTLNELNLIRRVLNLDYFNSYDRLQAVSIVDREIKLKTMDPRKKDEERTVDGDVIICRNNEGRDNKPEG